MSEDIKRSVILDFQSNSDAAFKSMKKLADEVSGLSDDYRELKDAVAEAMSEITKSTKETLKATKAVSKAIQETEKNTATSKKATEANTKATEANTKATTAVDKLAKAEAKLAYAQSDEAIKVAKLNAQISEQNRLNKLTVKLNDNVVNSYNELSAQHSLNKIALNKMSKEERETTKAGQELTAVTAKQKEVMKELQSVVGNNTLNVGNYEEATKNLNLTLEQAPGALGQATTGVKSFGASLKALLANPVVLMLSLLVGALSALFAAFKQTAVGAELFATVGAAIQGTFSAFVGIVNKLTPALKAVFEDPMESLKNFGQAIVDNIINRFTGVIDLVTSTGRAIGALFTGDLEGLKKAAGEAGTALIQMTSGLDKEQQKAIVDTVKKTAVAIVDQTKAFGALGAAQIAIRKENRELTRSLQDIITEEERLKILYEDDTKSWAVRQKAADEYGAKTLERAGIEKRIAQNNYALINAEIALRQKNGENIEDLKDQQLQAYTALEDANRSYLTTVQDQEEKNARRQRDLIEKNLDLIQSDTDTRRQLLQKNIEDEDQSFKARAKNISDLAKLEGDSFARQIQELQKLTESRIDANKLIESSDSETLLANIRALELSEIGEQRLIEIVKDRELAVNDVGIAYKELAKSQADGVAELLELTAAEQLQEIRDKYADVIASFGDVEAPTRNMFTSDEEYDEALYKHKSFLLTRKNQEMRLRQQMADDIEKLNEEQGQKEREHYAELADTISEWAGKASEVFSALDGLLQGIEDSQLEREQAKYDKETEMLNTQLEKGYISQEQYDAKQKKLDADLAKEQAKIERQQAIRSKAMAIFDIATSTAVAIMKTYAQFGFPVGIPMSIAMGAIGAVQIAAVAAQPLPKAAKGGLITGASHADGGVNIEAEGGESIINKRSTSMFGPMLSAINQAGGGVALNIPTSIPDGGYVSRYTQEMAGGSRYQNDQQIVVQVVDIIRGVEQYTEVVDGGSL